MQKIRKAVIPAAGYGTRMLPATKTVSKEMFPLVDKPIIQVVVEELVAAGIEDIIIVTSAHKTDIVDYFGETRPGLAAHLQEAGPSKVKLIEELESVRNLANFAFVEQRSGMHGTAVPALDAAPYLGGEPFIYTYADDFFIGDQSAVKQIMESYEEHNSPVIGCLHLDSEEDFKRYGYVDGESLNDDEISVQRMLEKPGIENAPKSGLAVQGYYVITPEVIKCLEGMLSNLPTDREFYINDGFNALMQDGGKVVAKKIVNADYFDTGNKLEYVKTVTAMAVRHPSIGQEYLAFLKDFVAKN